MGIGYAKSFCRRGSKRWSRWWVVVGVVKDDLGGGLEVTLVQDPLCGQGRWAARTGPPGDNHDNDDQDGHDDDCDDDNDDEDDTDDDCDDQDHMY